MRTEAEDFPTLDAFDRAVVMDAYEDGRPQSLAAVDLLVERAGLGPVSFVEPVRIIENVTDMTDAVRYMWARPLPLNMRLHEQPGHPRPASMILAEIDSPEGRAALANEDRRRQRAASRVTVTTTLKGAFPTEPRCYVNPPAGISIGGRSGKSAEVMRRGEELHRTVAEQFAAAARGIAAALMFIAKELRDAAAEAQHRENLHLLEQLHRKDSK